MGYIGSDPKTNESVSTAQLVDDSVTNAKIVDNVLFTSVTSSVVSASGTITADTFTGTFSGALSSSAQIATSISGSSTSLSSSLATRTTTLESASGSFSTRVTTIEGSGTAQGVGTSDSPTFNNITATGTVTAQEFHSEFVSASITYTSGSHKFGDSSDDVHSMTGSLNISGSLGINDGNVHVVDKIIIGSGSGFDFSGTNHSFNVKSSGNNSGFSVLASGGGELVRFVQESNDAGQMDFYDGGSPKIRLSSHANANNYISNGGNVGIGTTSPDAFLNVYNDNDSVDTLLHVETGGSAPTPNTYIRMTRIDANRANQLEFYTGGTRKWALGQTDSDSSGVDGTEFFIGQSYGGASPNLIITTGGNVGIGNTSPVGKLDIAQGGYTAGTQAIHFGADSGDNTSRSNNTTKYGVITGDHYSTSEEKIELITYYSNSSATSLALGGSGNSAYNAPTEIGLRIASGNTVTSNNAITILTINGAGATVKEGYPLYTGRGSTSGGRFLAQHYGQANGDFLNVLSSAYSSGEFILGYGVEGKENASGYVSTQDAFNVTRSAIQIGGTGVKFLATNNAVQTTPGSDITMGTMASISPDGDRNYMEIQGSSNATGITGSAGAKITLYNYNTTTNSFSSIRFESRDNDGTRYPVGELQFQKAGDHSSYVSGQFRIIVTDSGGNFQNRFQIANDGTFTGSSSNDISDRELKENIETIDNGLSKIKSLKGRTFNWKEEANMSAGKKYGVIAQELEDVGLNDLVIDHVGIKEKEDGTFYKSVNMSGIIPILIEAVKELTTRIEALES